ncbi:hypothetical protein EYZ11_012909 [Aspergillus tanneri]|uniref:Uncharacterized protein n=1 Tax=Aspergillus tanneri TaxID=1220188 RepID=A0A4S3J154_9EURO|nr:hypothetical protein EYZ11_012909 [Aspergillus tanneri]
MSNQYHRIQAISHDRVYTDIFRE